MFGLTSSTSTSDRRRTSSLLRNTLATSLLLLAAASTTAASPSFYFNSAEEELQARHRHIQSNQARAHNSERATQQAQAHARRGLPMGSSIDAIVNQKRASGAFASSGFDYVNDKVRGVNLGNWLVLEPWMDNNASQVLNANAVNAPGAHSVIDEYTAGTYIDHDFLTQFFTEHFDSWITEDDFRQIAAAGLNHVRIPIGHWAFSDCIEDNLPYLPLNRFDKLKEGVGYAQKYGLKVWIDLHGTPGSQNGYPGSGRAGVAHWPNQDSYYTLTQTAFNHLIAEFTQEKYNGTVTGIQPVNEPVGAYQKNVQTQVNRYYPWSWDALAYPNGLDNAPSNQMLVTHDAWQGLSYWQNWWNQTQAKRVIMDAHPYFVYGPQEMNATDTFRLQEVCQYGIGMSQSQGFYPTVAGEWSIGAPSGDNNVSLRTLPNTDQVIFPYGSGKYPFSQKYMQFLAVNFRTQQEVFEEGSGWMFWNWKHLAFADQSYQTGIKFGWLPSDARGLDNNPFGKLCVNNNFQLASFGAGGSGAAPSLVHGRSGSVWALATGAAAVVAAVIFS